MKIGQLPPDQIEGAEALTLNGPSAPGYMPDAEGIDVDIDAGENTADEMEIKSEQERQLVTKWWTTTEQKADLEELAKQIEMDTITIAGGNAAEIANENIFTTFDVYRNAIQTVAMTVPGVMSMEYRPKAIVEPMGMDLPLGHPMRQEIEILKRKRAGLSRTLTCLMHEYANLNDLEEKFEAIVQDATHYPIAIVKTFFQVDINVDSISDERLSDKQDQVEHLRVMIEDREREMWSQSDYRNQEIKNLMDSMQIKERDIQRGIVMSIVPPLQYRIDPAVMTPESKRKAKWERNDVLMRRDDILATFANLTDEDMNRASMYDLDTIGRIVKQDKIDRTSSNTSDAMVGKAVVDLNRDIKLSGADNGDEGWHLVAEIHDYVTNTRITLVEGVTKVADKQPLRDGESMFEILVLNRRSDRFVGYSDTGLQAKLQRLKHRMRTQEEQSKKNAQPRFAYDPASIINTTDTIKNLSNSEPWDMIPVSVAKGVLKDCLIPLVGNHDHSAAEHDSYKVDMELRKAAMLPEQALGVTGNADFAAEVNVAAAASNVMAKYRGRIIIRFIKRIMMRVAKQLLHNLSPEEAVRVCGPAAILYWPQSNDERMQMLDGMTIEAQPTLDQDLDSQKKVAGLNAWTDALARVPPWINKKAYARLSARYLGLPENGQDLVQPDPAGLVEELMMAMQDGEQMPPEVLQALMQIGMSSAEKLQQIQAQQMEAQQGEQNGPVR